MKNSYKKSDYYFFAFMGAIILILVYYFWSVNKPGELDSFARCLQENNVKFYGAFWCPHCQAQKKIFGNSSKLLPYTECSTADQRGMLQVCIDNNIKSYPTWEFKDGSRLEGEVSLQELSAKTNCPLPGSLGNSPIPTEGTSTIIN